MSIDIDAHCDNRGCRTRLDAGAEVYCGSCYSELERKIEELETEIETLKKVTP